MRRSGALFATMVVLTVAVAAAARAGNSGRPTAGDRARQGTPAEAIRLVRSLPQGPAAECIPDPCFAKPVPLGSMTAPADAAAVDVTVTLSLRYRTSVHDHGFLFVDFSPQGDRAAEMRPGRYPLDSQGRQTSTSLTWVERGLTGSGTEYSFSVGAQSYDSEGPGFSKISTGRVTMVIEMWPSSTAANGGPSLR
jgi:hypothetical protein